MTVLRERYALGGISWSDAFSIEYYAVDRKSGVNRMIRELFPVKMVQRMADGSVSCIPGCEEEWEKAGKRFRKEAQVLLLFKEDGEKVMPELLDMFEESGTTFQVYDDPGTETIGKILEDRGRPFREKELKPYALKLFGAVRKAHMRGVLLLNLRADRITADPDGSVHLAVFGNRAGSVRSGSVAEPDAEAPERFQEGQKTGPWTDIYELGYLLMKMLGLKGSLAEDKTGQEKKTCSDRLRQVLEKAVKADPKERYGSIDEFFSAYTESGGKTAGNWILPAAVILTGALVFILSGAGSFLVQGTREWFAADHPEEILAVSEPDSSAFSLENDSAGATESAVELTAESTVSFTKGEEVSVQPGTYVIECADHPDLVLGIDSGFGDNGARALLTTERSRNCEKFFIEDAGNSWYYIKAAHTGSFLTSDSGPEYGGQVHQDAHPAKRRRWKFRYLEGDSGDLTVEIVTQGGGGLSPAEGIVQGGCGTRLRDDEDGGTGWKLVWSEYDSSEGNVPVFEPGQIVEGLEGIHCLEYAADQSVRLAVSQASDLPERRAIVWRRSDDETQQFEFRRERESRYRIFPVFQEGEIRKCLEYDPDSGMVSSKIPSDSQNQLFRVRYGGYNLFIVQTSDESCLGAEPRDDGDFNGKYILSIPWEAYTDPLRCEWFIRDGKGA